MGSVSWPDTRTRTAQELAREAVMRDARNAGVDGDALRQTVVAALREGKPGRVIDAVRHATERLQRFESVFRTAWGAELDERGEPVRVRS